MYLYFKHYLDKIIAFLLTVLLAPVWVGIAVAIKIDDNGAIFYKQIRLGKNGKAFEIIKFRTMRENSDKIELSLTEEQKKEFFREYKLENDPRTTKIGQILRITCFDEIPQLINVLKGDLSIIGPRPIVPEEIQFYNEDELRQLLSITPGLTGYWQSYGRHKASYSDQTRQQYELFYVNNISLGLDLKIMIKTIRIIFGELIKLIRH